MHHCITVNTFGNLDVSVTRLLPENVYNKDRESEIIVFEIRIIEYYLNKRGRSMLQEAG